LTYFVMTAFSIIVTLNFIVAKLLDEVILDDGNPYRHPIF